MSVMVIVALLGLNGCGGDDDSTSESAESVLAGETLYSARANAGACNDAVG